MTSNDEETKLIPQMTKPPDLAADEEWEILHRAIEDKNTVPWADEIERFRKTHIIHMVLMGVAFIVVVAIVLIFVMRI